MSAIVIRLPALLLAVAIGTASIAQAAVSQESAVSPEERLLLDAADGALDDHDLLAAALVAGGIDEAVASGVVARFQAWLSQFDIAALPNDTRDAAETVFTALHAALLRGEYQASCSDVAIALDTGDFNCLSATVLYVCAARHCGLTAVPLATDGHVLCEITDESGSFEVETTCANWFRLSHADACAAKELRLAPPAGGSAKSRQVRRLSDVELLAKIYYNRGVAALRESCFESGLALTRVSLELDPHDEVARGNILAGLNNWALALSREGDHARAAELLAEVRKLDANYPTLADNEAHIERVKAASSP